MINFSDKTILEGQGNFRIVRDIMESEGPSTWMLRSSATVDSPEMSADYVLHFWHDGKVVIVETNRPISPDVPSDDLRELSLWCRRRGWQGLQVHDRLIQERKEIDFWIRLYYSGTVTSPVLQKYDDDDMKRMSEIEEEDDDDVY